MSLRALCGWLLGLLTLSCASPRAQATVSEAEPRSSFPVAIPRSAEGDYEREYVGEVHAVRYAEVRARLKGIVEKVSVDEGQPVKEGQLLFSISAREQEQELLKARAQAKSAEAELSLARLEHDNTKMLFDKNVVSSAELELASSKVAALAARVEEARASANQAGINLTYAQVRAPFEGVVNRIPRKAGSMVATDDLLTTLTDTSFVYVYFRVSERELLEYTSGDSAAWPSQARLHLADGTALPETGTIDSVESEIDRGTGTLAFRAKFPNPRRSLRHGASAKVVLRTPVAGGLVVPQKSTFEVQGSLFVYVVDERNVVHTRKIIPRLRHGDTFVVASGLSANERFILEGVQKVKDGMRVDVTPAG